MPKMREATETDRFKDTIMLNDQNNPKSAPGNDKRPPFGGGNRMPLSFKLKI